MRPAPRLEPRVTDREGQAVHQAVREVELRRRWRSAIIWAVSLSTCAAFGWLSLLAFVLGPGGVFERVRLNALVAFAAGTLCLIVLAWPHLKHPAARRLSVLGGILYLGALGGLVVLGIWLACLALLLTVAPDITRTGTGAFSTSGSERAWLLSGGLVLLLGGGVAAILSRLPPRLHRP